MTDAEQAAYDLGFRWGYWTGDIYGRIGVDCSDKDHPPFHPPTGYEWVWTWMGTRSDPSDVYEWRLRKVTT